MRFQLKILFSFLLLTAISCGFWVAEAQAGPLLDWIRSWRCWRCAQPCAQPALVASPCTTCQTTCQQTCSRVVVNYVPCTAYRTCWERVPVTQYRQTTTTDPCTGCTVTCQRPCTTYSWRMKQVPYTTYRPVYRRETYQVPVTYTTQVAASPCATCDTGCGNGCSVPIQYQAPAGTINPGTTVTPYYQPTPAQGGTVIQSEATGTTPAADLRPSLNTQDLQRPIIEVPSSSSWTPSALPSPSTTYPSSAGITPLQDPEPAARWQENAAPQLINPFNKTTQTPAIQPWNYSPVRVASFETEDGGDAGPREYMGNVRTAAPRGANPPVNAGWRSGSR